LPPTPQSNASGKITNAFPAAHPNLFYLISPEAVRMTDSGQGQHLIVLNNAKEAVARKPTRPGVWPVKWQRLGLLDLLVTFGSSQK
jgi:hypothetical protein